ncbi:MAG TPA: DUF2905 domain-containing protein [Bacteroidota bacterium]|nr:DUF2905 domain-containing protein [Bacteroidota bacterium]
MQPIGKLLVIFGIVIIGMGFLLMFFERIPFLGKLPGDIHVKKENFQFYFPITTSVVLSVIVSAILWLISILSKK